MTTATSPLAPGADTNLATGSMLRFITAGSVDDGKSTLIGVLTRGELDNGRGLARNACFRHKHEIDNGRTSSVSQQFLGFDNEGDVTNYTAVRGAATTQEVLTKSSKIVNFIDLCGHERYLKTTVFGLTGAVPDYAMIMLGANMGVQRMTREHLGLTLALRLPFFIVITKIDLAPPNVREETISRISRILKSANVRKMPYLVNDEEGVISCSWGYAVQPGSAMTSSVSIIGLRKGSEASAKKVIEPTVTPRSMTEGGTGSEGARGSSCSAAAQRMLA